MKLLCISSSFPVFSDPHIKLPQQQPPGCDFLTDSAETSKAKVTVEMSHSSVKMRAATQLPTVGPDDDLTGILLQVGLSSEAFFFISALPGTSLQPVMMQIKLIQLVCSPAST